MADFTYILRYFGDPERAKETAPALMDFVREGRIDDVMVFSYAEDLNQGHITHGEQETLMAFMADLQKQLEPMGVTVSINPWTTLAHADRGRMLREDQNFGRMVDPCGCEAALAACPLDERFRAYLRGVYARYASLHPRMIWVEDDFRFHNHDPLHWGGCFCEAHMKEYARRAGGALTREEFVRGVLQPGDPHPYRKIWLDTSRDVLVSLAEAIGQAVRTASEGTQVGLMSSAPAVHCAEGRDWRGILEALAAGGPTIDRIHLPAYQDRVPGEYQWLFNRISMHTRAFIPRETLAYPELENYPYSRFSKSARFSRFQIESAMALGLAGITMNLHDVLGNGCVAEEGYAPMLAELKPFLNRLSADRTLFGPRAGVQVLTNPASSYTLHTPSGKAMEELYPRETFWAGLLGAFGVPFDYALSPDVSGAVVAVSGQYFRNLSRAQLDALFFGNFVIVDGEAADTLCDMGHGDLLHIADRRWEPQNSGVCAFEEVADEERYLGLKRARASAQTFLGDALMIEYTPDAPVYAVTQLCDFARQRVSGGLAIIDDRALVLPYGRYAVDPPWSLLGSLRREIIAHILMSLPARYAAPPMVRGRAHLSAYCYPREDGFSLYLVNATLDDLRGLRVYAGKRAVTRAHKISSAGEGEVRFTRSDGEMLLDTGMGPLECALYHFG